MTVLELTNHLENEANKDYQTCPLATEPTINDCQSNLLNKESYFVLQAVIIVLTSFCIMLLSTVIVLGIFWGSAATCQRGTPVGGWNLKDPDIFDELTLTEFYVVKKYLFSQPKLNLQSYNTAKVNSSYIFLIDTLLPLKSSVLRQLDRGDKKPKRNAQVILFRGDLIPPRVEEYHVGPLPDPEYHTLVTNPSYTTPRIPFASRPMSKIEQREIDKLLKDINKELFPLLDESYGLSYHNCTNSKKCIVYHGNTPRGSNSGERRTWFSGYRFVEGLYLHPLGIHMEINHAPVNSDEWSVEKLVYNNIEYLSVNQLMQKYLEGKLRLVQISKLAFNEYQYSSITSGGKKIQSVLQGPKLVEPEGRRYTVIGNHVKFLNWDLQVRMRAVSGLQLFDVRFEDERILYEISLQEILVIQNGKGPMGVNYLSADLLGSRSYELVPGVDCPHTAIFRDMNKYSDSENGRKFQNVICIFENTANIPLIRHVTVNDKDHLRYYGGLIKNYLVVRTIHTIWNADFIVDYCLFQNGGIEVKVSVSGYPQTIYGRNAREQGNRIHENVLSNIQQFLFHFKVDLDINGVYNRFAFLDISENTISDNIHVEQKHQRLLFEEKVLLREHDIFFEEKFERNKYNVFFNDKATSKFGSKRSYRIINMSPAEPIYQGHAMNAAKWTSFPIAISQQKDAEDKSTSIYAQNDPWDPVVDFERFLRNNESIVDQDLVAWIAMGTTLIPHTENVPALTTLESFVYFQLLPFNYFTQCPSISSENVVHISSTGGDNVVRTNESSKKLKCTQEEIDINGFSGSWSNLTDNK